MCRCTQFLNYPTHYSIMNMEFPILKFERNVFMANDYVQKMHGTQVIQVMVLVR